MALRLDVISDHRQRLGERSSIVFGVSGGSIGRALDNDWVLPDPHRFLSAHHARIQFRQGAFYLEDSSTNGVYVNDATTPLGRRGLYALRNADVLRLGEYRIRVVIDAEQPVPTPSTGTMAQMSVERVVPLRAVGAAQDDLGASLNLEALIPGEVTGSLARIAPEAAPGRQPKPELTAQQRLTRLRAAARARLEGGSATPLADMRNGLQAFCRGAGIDPARMPMESEARSLQLAGQLVREAILGLKEILRAQQGFRDHFHIETTAHAEEKLPLDGAADDYMLRLFAGHEKRELDAVLQLRGHFSRAGKHDRALDPALLSALEQFMAHLSPASIESRARDLGGAGADANWRRYKEVYGSVLNSTGNELPHLFTEAVAQAYLKIAETDSSDSFKAMRE